MGVRARARHAVHRARRATAATATTATPTTSRSSATSASASYRFSIEWSRIEPEDGEFSRAALDYYRRVLANCHEHGVAPVVTFHHFTTPRWMADRGGWVEPRGRRPVHALLREGGRAPRRPHRDGLHDQRAQRRVDAGLPHGAVPARAPRLRSRTAKANGEPAATRTVRSYDVLKAGPGDFPVGLTVSMRTGGRPRAAKRGCERARAMHEDFFLEAARGNDFVGVQAYTRIRIGLDGLPIGGRSRRPDVESMGYEYWPQGSKRRSATRSRSTGCPVYVTENGIGIDDDEVRIKYVTEALEGVGALPRRRARRARLLLLVAARQLRVGRGLQAPVRSGRGRPGDVRAHAQAQRGLARRARPSEPPARLRASAGL